MDQRLGQLPSNIGERIKRVAIVVEVRPKGLGVRRIRRDSALTGTAFGRVVRFCGRELLTSASFLGFAFGLALVGGSWRDGRNILGGQVFFNSDF